MKRRAKKEDMRTTRNPQTNDCGQLPTGACLHSGRKPEVQLMTHPDTAGDRKYPSMLKQIWKVERWSGGEVERWSGGAERRRGVWSSGVRCGEGVRGGGAGWKGWRRRWVMW